MKSSVERMLYVTLLLVFILACIFTFLTVQTVNHFKEQQSFLQQQVDSQKEVLQGVRELVSNQGKTTAEINHSLSCILTFFTRPNRADYYISDLTTCTFTNTSTGTREVLVLPTIGDLPDESSDTNADQTSAPLTQPASPASPPTNPTPDPSVPTTPSPQPVGVFSPITNFIRNVLNITKEIL